jgi:hypothetical protein
MFTQLFAWPTDLVATIEPKKISLDLGSSCSIRCRLDNQSNLAGLKFQWYKYNRLTNQFEAITGLENHFKNTRFILKANYIWLLK